MFFLAVLDGTRTYCKELKTMRWNQPIITYGVSLLAFYFPLKASSVDLTELANKYASDKGNQYACAHYYTRHYAQLFDDRRENIQAVLEIGLNLSHRFDCASLRMWLDYFPNAHIYGIDIIPQSFSHKRVTTFVGDQRDAAFLESYSRRFSAFFDIIIDDATHVPRDQQVTFVKLFHALKPGGIYIIEDMGYDHQFYDESGVVATRVFLERLHNNDFVQIGGIDQQEITAIVHSIDSITLLDSAKGGEKFFGIVRKRIMPLYD